MLFPNAIRSMNIGHKDIEMASLPFRLHYFEYGDGARRFTIWGLTASVLIRIARILFDRKPAFDEFHLTNTNYREILIEMLKRNLLVP